MSKTQYSKRERIEEYERLRQHIDHGSLGFEDSERPCPICGEAAEKVESELYRHGENVVDTSKYGCFVYWCDSCEFLVDVGKRLKSDC